MINLTQEQKKKLELLWFVYGNYGKKHSDGNHRFIQNLLEKGEDYRKLFKPSKEAKKAVDEILKSVETTEIRIEVTSRTVSPKESESEQKRLSRFHNFYNHCGEEWENFWDSGCDDECPVCGCDISPYESIDTQTEEVKT